MTNNLLYKILNIIGIGLIITSGVIAVQVYYNEKTAECSADPLVYAAKMYEEKTGYPFSGTGSFSGGLNQVNFPIISFDSDGVDVSYLNKLPANNLVFNLNQTYHS